ncbi:hypothetical protein ACTXGK_13055 [Psychrobacter sp. T6-5]|uniref:hypothetical protein n=1 Tax=Psychrobacter sp. T6-5 TaxID=3457451 RepID=UPI003FD36C25
MIDIITSILIYKNRIYIANLDGKINVSSLFDLHSRGEVEHINLSGKIIIDIQAYKNKIYILTNNGLYSYENERLILIKNLHDATHIAIDRLKRMIFVLSATRGLICLSLSKEDYLGDIRFISNVDLSQEESITDIIASNGKIFISIMNRGVYRIDYEYREKRFQMKAFLKRALTFPQSLYFNELLNELSIIDYVDGLIVTNIDNGESTYNRYFDSTNPNKVISLKNGKKIVQTRSALYLIEKNENSVIIDYQVANLISYHNYIYYSKDGSVSRLKI